MSATGIITKKGRPLSDRIIQASLYVVLTAILATFLEQYVSDILSGWKLPLPEDGVVMFGSVIFGLLITTILMFFMRRAYEKRGRESAGK